ncbi:DUF3263 domain-containing protein [Gordonia insulae]|uniref:DUF3263 domain-containing protein n=1 Tax=Gordonia insulae TaxID=2420509 RepID=UPI001E42089A|nr:DUF3263 domain-containing protein [Gordonia insulae]
MLDVSGRRWRYAGSMAAAVEAEFGVTVTRFWQIINGILDDPDAIEYSPLTVNRLRRLRSARAQARSAR